MKFELCAMLAGGFLFYLETRGVFTLARFERGIAMFLFAGGYLSLFTSVVLWVAGRV